MDDICEKPAKLIHAEVAQSPSLLDTLNVKHTQNIRKCLYRKRRAHYSKLPTNLPETFLWLDKEKIETCKQENFLLANCRKSNIVIFSCNSNLSCLTSCSTLYMDGTFDYAPKHLLQMFSLHGIVNGHYIPLVFCLLPNKSKESYLNSFKIIKEKCMDLGLTFLPNQIVVDFEYSIHQAIKEMWSSVTIIGCRFHLSQSWIRKIQKLGLMSEYKNHNSKIGNFLNWIFGLSFLEPETVGDCFAFDFLAEDISDSRVTKFLDYLTENYVEENSLFPPQLWASASVTSERTTNCCESFHSEFNKNFYQTHPNIIQFLEVLKQFQTKVYIKINSVNIQKRIFNKKYRERLEHLNKILKQYKNNEIDRFHFVKAASFHYGKLF